MKTIPLALVASIIVAGTSMSVAEVMIDTDFAETDAGNIPASSAVQSAADFPLMRPTLVGFASPSSVITSNEAINGLNPPFALVTQVKPSGEPGTPKKPYASLIWNVRNAPLPPAVYDISWIWLTITEVRGLDFLIALAPIDDAGNIIKSGKDRVLTISLSGDQVLAMKQAWTLKPGTPHAFHVRLDLANRTWSLEIDGESLFQDTAFFDSATEKQANPENLAISQLRFLGGLPMDLELNEVKYAVSKFKVEEEAQ